VVDSDHPPTIAEVMSLSIVLSFTTSRAGWQQLGAGSLLTRPSGEADGRHAILIESYDLANDYVRVKNSWGRDPGAINNGRCYLRLSALHPGYHFIKVSML
jgi:hypothetical protein